MLNFIASFFSLALLQFAAPMTWKEIEEIIEHICVEKLEKTGCWKEERWLKREEDTWTKGPGGVQGVRETNVAQNSDRKLRFDWLLLMLSWW